MESEIEFIIQQVNEILRDSEIGSREYETRLTNLIMKKLVDKLNNPNIKEALEKRSMKNLKKIIQRWHLHYSLFYLPTTEE